MSDERRPGPVTRPLRSPLHEALPQSDLSNSVYAGVQLSDRDLHQSLFTESLFRDCTFRRVDFNNSDFDGVRVENCAFEECNFTDCDMRASTLANVRFIDCTFDSIYLSDCTFANCTLDRTSFVSAALSQNSFSDCMLRNCDLNRSTLTRSRFETTHFDHMTLGDCTFLYIVMRGCSFSECSINAESIGMIYGLRADELARFRFIFLGQLQEAPEPDKILLMTTGEYEKRGWQFGVLILRLNFRLTSALFAIRRYIEYMVQQVSNGRSPKRDDLDFLATVISELASENRLPLLACFDALEASWDVLRGCEERQDVEARHTAAAMRRFSAEIIMHAQDRLAYFDTERLQIEHAPADAVVAAEGIFHVRPTSSFADFVNRVTMVSPLEPAAETRYLSDVSGSYVEVVQTTIYSLVALQIALFLLNGCIIQMTELKERINVLRSRTAGKAYRARALTAEQEIPPVVQKVLDNLIPFLRKAPEVHDPAIGGLSENNLVNVKVAPTPKELDPRAKSQQ